MNGNPIENDAPTVKQWQSLTDDEIALLVAECASSAYHWDDFGFARAIEDALKRKNT